MTDLGSACPEDFTAPCTSVRFSGGEVPVTRARGGAVKTDFPPREVPTFDVRGRTVLYFSDLHLFSKRRHPSARKLECLRQFIESVPDPFVVFGGDIFEMRVTGWDRIRGGLERGRSGGRRRSDRAFSDLCATLDGVDTVLLAGNHDPWDWYGDSRIEGELYGFLARRIRLVTEKGSYLAAHGHEVFVDHDQATWGGIHRIPSPLVRLFFYYEVAGFSLFGNPFLRWMYRHINRAFHDAATALRGAFDVDGVILGHSHLPEMNDAAGLYVCGFTQHGQLNSVVIDPGGEFRRETLWYTATAEVLHRWRRRLRIDKP